MDSIPLERTFFARKVWRRPAARFRAWGTSPSRPKARSVALLGLRITRRGSSSHAQVCYWRSLDPSLLESVILYCWMQSDDLGEQIAAVAGQTDMAPYVSLQDQRQFAVPIFPQSQHTVARNIEAVLARRSLNAAEMKTLAALRDTLMPKLISGELRVRHSERFVAEAAS